MALYTISATNKKFVSYLSHQICRLSDGSFHIAAAHYEYSAPNTIQKLVVYSSDDNGATWSESVLVTSTVNNPRILPKLWLVNDSQDTLHLLYCTASGGAVSIPTQQESTIGYSEASYISKTSTGTWSTPIVVCRPSDAPSAGGTRLLPTVVGMTIYPTPTGVELLKLWVSHEESTTYSGSVSGFPATYEQRGWLLSSATKYGTAEWSIVSGDTPGATPYYNKTCIVDVPGHPELETCPAGIGQLVSNAEISVDIDANIHLMLNVTGGLVVHGSRNRFVSTWNAATTLAVTAIPDSYNRLQCIPDQLGNLNVFYTKYNSTDDETTVVFRQRTRGVTAPGGAGTNGTWGAETVVATYDYPSTGYPNPLGISLDSEKIYLFWRYKTGADEGLTGDPDVQMTSKPLSGTTFDTPITLETDIGFGSQDLGSYAGNFATYYNRYFPSVDDTSLNIPTNGWALAYFRPTAITFVFNVSDDFNQPGNGGIGQIETIVGTTPATIDNGPQPTGTNWFEDNPSDNWAGLNTCQEDLLEGIWAHRRNRTVTFDYDPSNLPTDDDPVVCSYIGVAITCEALDTGLDAGDMIPNLDLTVTVDFASETVIIPVDCPNQERQRFFALFPASIYEIPNNTPFTGTLESTGIGFSTTADYPRLNVLAIDLYLFGPSVTSGQATELMTYLCGVDLTEASIDVACGDSHNLPMRVHAHNNTPWSFSLDQLKLVNLIPGARIDQNGDCRIYYYPFRGDPSTVTGVIFRVGARKLNGDIQAALNLNGQAFGVSQQTDFSVYANGWYVYDFFWKIENLTYDSDQIGFSYIDLTFRKQSDDTSLLDIDFTFLNYCTEANTYLSGIILPEPIAKPLALPAYQWSSPLPPSPVVPPPPPAIGMTAVEPYRDQNGNLFQRVPFSVRATKNRIIVYSDPLTNLYSGNLNLGVSLVPGLTQTFGVDAIDTISLRVDETNSIVETKRTNRTLDTQSITDAVQNSITTIVAETGISQIVTGYLTIHNRLTTSQTMLIQTSGTDNPTYVTTLGLQKTTVVLGPGVTERIPYDFRLGSDVDKIETFGFQVLGTGNVLLGQKYVTINYNRLHTARDYYEVSSPTTLNLTTSQLLNTNFVTQNGPVGTETWQCNNYAWLADHGISFNANGKIYSASVSGPTSSQEVQFLATTKKTDGTLYFAAITIPVVIS